MPLDRDVSLAAGRWAAPSSPRGPGSPCALSLPLPASGTILHITHPHRWGREPPALGGISVLWGSGVGASQRQRKYFLFFTPQGEKGGKVFLVSVFAQRTTPPQLEDSFTREDLRACSEQLVRASPALRQVPPLWKAPPPSASPTPSHHKPHGITWS